MIKLSSWHSFYHGGGGGKESDADALPGFRIIIMVAAVKAAYLPDLSNISFRDNFLSVINLSVLLPLFFIQVIG
jgi:hypothetical protein